jgi:hypothetical protein
VKDTNLSIYLQDANPFEVKTGGTSLILYRCPRCGREFARERDQSVWRAVRVGVFGVEFLQVTVSERWVSEPCPAASS